jgi:hypothetical protein
MSVCSYQCRREIGDHSAQFVGFQIKECVDQARAMSGKRHLDEGWRLDLLGVLCTGWQFIEKYRTSTSSTAAICTNMAALMRFLPFSYF